MQTTRQSITNASTAVSRHVFEHSGHVTAVDRQHLLQQRAATVWLTGLSGAGKSTLAYEVERRLLHRGVLSFVLDGDNLRHRLNNDLGFSALDRQENIRRAAEVASLMNDAGLIVFSALISPRRQDRAMARSIIGAPRFLEVHVSTALPVCEGRDPKGLYTKARAGLIPNFTGVSAPYEEPEDPALCLDTSQRGLEDCADDLMALLARCGLVR
jgi:adenylylsulfate kinase